MVLILCSFHLIANYCEVKYRHVWSRYDVISWIYNICTGGFVLTIGLVGRRVKNKINKCVGINSSIFRHVFNTRNHKDTR